MRMPAKLALAWAVGLSQVAVADQYQPAGQVQSPIKDVTPYVDKDKRTVIAFFKFNCSFCRSYHPSLIAWGKSLPKGISFEFHPVIEPGNGNDISDSSMYGMHTFWVSERLGRQAQKESFAEAAYSLAQDEHADMDRDRWFSALTEQGYKAKDVAVAWKAEIDLVNVRFARQMHYAPTSTPTLVVCGKWMVSTEAANGNEALFAQLINGLVSRCATELGLN